MLRKLLLPAALVLLSLRSSAETLEFRDFGFSLESPSSWQAKNPPPNDTIGFIQNPDGSKGFVIMAFRLEKERLSNALDGMIDGARKNFVKAGSEIRHEKAFSINGVPFKTITAQMPTGVSIVSNMGLAGDIGYSLQGFSKVSDAGTDAEIAAIANSFIRLNRTPPASGNTQPDRTAYRFGQLAGTVAGVVFIGGLIWILISKAKNPRVPKEP